MYEPIKMNFQTANSDMENFQVELAEICQSLNISVQLKQFQIDFMAKAILGISGFLLVSLLMNALYNYLWMTQIKSDFNLKTFIGPIIYVEP